MTERKFLCHKTGMKTVTNDTDQNPADSSKRRNRRISDANVD